MILGRLKVILLASLFVTNCTSSPKAEEEVIEPEQLVAKASSKQGEDTPSEELEIQSFQKLREEIEEFKDSLRREIRAVIREEIVPEIWTHSIYPQEVAAKQKEVRKRAKVKTFLGRVEWVRFKDPDFELQSRVDSGTKTSSLHAENIRERTINGELFVQFETVDHNNKRHTLVRRVVSKTTVKNTAGEASHRYVIRERISLGGRSHEVNVNLNDRSNLRYKFLIGRNLLIGNYIVDVSKSHILGDKL